MDQWTTQRAGDVVVDLQKHAVALFQKGLGTGAHRPKTEISLFIHGRDDGKEGIHPCILGEQCGDIPVVAGEVFTESSIDGAPSAGAGEPGESLQLRPHILLIKGQGGHIHDGIDPQILYLSPADPLRQIPI